MIGRRGREERAAFGRFVLGQATLLVLLATAAGAAIIPSDFGHFLELDGKDGRSCTKPCWRTPSSMNNCSPSIAIWRRGGARHQANYRRKPRGRPAALGEEHDRRFSFCCSVDGCRDRSTPPSLRFLGRKVYLAVIVTLIAAMRDGVTERRLGKLAATVGVDRRTVT